MLTAISNFYPRSINDVAKTLLDLNKTLQNSHMYISKPSNYYSECPNSHVLVVGKHMPPTPCFSRAILAVLRQLERDATQSASQWLIAPITTNWQLLRRQHPIRNQATKVLHLHV